MYVFGEDDCLNCGRPSISVHRVFKCPSCGTVFCDLCSKSIKLSEPICPKCGSSGRTLHGNPSEVFKREAEAKKRAEAEAKRRAEEEAKRRADMLKELENRQYGLGLRIGNRYYSDYDD